MLRHIPSDEARRKAKAARAANIASTKPTTRPGSETTTLVVGDTVTVSLRAGAADSRGYNGRTGRVASINTQTFLNGTTYVEIGVTFRKQNDMAKASAEAWFRVDEVLHDPR